MSTALRGSRGARGVVLAGVAGVGKTRLARDAIELAARGGFSVRWVWATASSHRTPFGAFEGMVGTPDPDPARVVARAADAVLAASGEVLVGVDDAHLLDELSAHLVHHLAVERGVPLDFDAAVG